MKNLLRFLIKYHVTILFVFLETIALVMVGRNDSFHNSKLYGLKHAIVGNIAKKHREKERYRNLDSENRRLVFENANLYNSLPSSFIRIESFKPDTNTLRKYYYIPAEVINNSVNKQHNFITLNKGRENGINPGDAVICDQGIVGVVKSVSDHFASVIPVLNRDFFPNARIKNNEFFGYIEWPGRDYRKVLLKDIPGHAVFNVGDSVVTSGYSLIFPENIMIGRIKDFELEQGVQYQISVELSTDFKNLSNVMVVKNLLKDEQKNLEDSLKHD